MPSLTDQQMDQLVDASARMLLSAWNGEEQRDHGNKISALYHTLFQSREGQRDEAWLWQILNWIWNTSRYMPGR